MEAGPDPAVNNIIEPVFVLSNLIKKVKVFLSIIQSVIIDTHLWKNLSEIHNVYNKILTLLNNKNILIACITSIINVLFFWTNLATGCEKLDTMIWKVSY